MSETPGEYHVPGELQNLELFITPHLKQDGKDIFRKVCGFYLNPNDMPYRLAINEKTRKLLMDLEVARYEVEVRRELFPSEVIFLKSMIHTFLKETFDEMKA